MISRDMKTKSCEHLENQTIAWKLKRFLDNESFIWISMDTS
jgi:hypothetical protein